MKEIALTQGKVAIVDDEDHEALAMYKWQAYRRRKTFYVKRSLPRVDGKRPSEHMHQVVFARKIGRPPDDNMECDHINGDGLDNRRENLREVTTAQNQRNCQRSKKNRSSQYLGVAWHGHTKKWQARIGVAWKSIYLGCYSTELAAAQAREAYIAAHPELHAKSNFAEGAGT